MKNDRFPLRPALFRVILAVCTLCTILSAPPAALAVTRAELLSGLWRTLGYPAPANVSLPPDVPREHRFAKEIGGAAQYGLIPKTEFFPDTQLNRRDAVRLTLSMMGWDFEVSLYETLATLPDLGGSGDPVFFLAAETIPPAPKTLLVDGMTPLSDSAQAALLNWAAACRKQIVWNRVFSYGGTDLILYRQGVARPGETNTAKDHNPVGAPDCEPLFVAGIGVHTAEVDQRIAFAGPLGKTSAPLSELASAYEVIAAVNGGFFSNGRPLGTTRMDGEHVGKPLAGRSAVGWSNLDGTWRFGPGEARIGVDTPAGFLEFTRFNVAPQMNEAALYNAGVAPFSVGTAQDALQLVVRDGVVVERREASEGNHRIPDGCTMIAARGGARAQLEHLRNGNPVRIRTHWEAGAFESCTDVIQCGPMLLRNGNVLTGGEGLKPTFTDKRHPRTIVGTDGSRLIWAVIDGRSAIRSRGASLPEAARIARSLGLTNALNLDGGGSSQIIWRGVTVNRPSDGKERPLPYGIVMLPKGTPFFRTYVGGAWGDPGVLEDIAAPVDDGEVPFMDVYTPVAGY